MAISIRSRIRKYLNGAYHVGIIDNFDLSAIKNGTCPQINWIDMKGHDESWFADPFILHIDDTTITLLVEEYFHSTNKGCLSEITISRSDYGLISVKQVLMRQTHLSFPYIISCANGNLYVCPESEQQSEVALYRYDGKDCIYDHRLLDGRYVDTQIIEYDGKVYAFAVVINNGGMSDTKRLQIFEAATLDGPFRKIQEIQNDRCEERGAGPIFYLEDKLIRPAQICERGYGKGVVFYELVHQDGVFIENEIGRIAADPSLRYGLCFHTFSPKDGIVAVDGFDYKIRSIGRIAPMIYKVKASIHKLLH